MNSANSDNSAILTKLINRFIQSFSLLIQTRLKIFSIELIEEKNKIIRLIVTGIITLLFAGVTIITFSLMIVVLCWNKYRWQSITTLTIIYSTITIWLLFFIQNNIRKSTHFFKETIREFKKDSDFFTHKE